MIRVFTKKYKIISLIRYYLKKVLRNPLLIFIPSRKLSRRKRVIINTISLAILAIFIPLVLYTFQNIHKADAAWFDTNWSFRKSITISTHTSAENNVYINLTGANAIDTSDTTRFQADCGDLRFTDVRGNILPYYIVSGCGTTSTVVHVFFESFPAGAQTIYFYYGNPSAADGFNTSDFSVEAASYTIGSQGSEEAGAAPIAYWKLDDGTGTTATDASSNRINGTLNSFDPAPSTRSGWMQDSQCLINKCLLFNGSNSYVSTADKDMFSPSVNSMSISFWAKVPTGATAVGNGTCGTQGAYMVAKGNTSNWEWAFENDNNSLICLNLWQTNGNAYSLLTVNRTVNDGQWHHYAATIQPGVLVTLYIDGVLVASANSGFSGSMGNGTQPVEIGRRGDGNYTTAFIDEVKIYKYIRTASQIKVDYNSRGGTSANVLGATDANKNLTNGLVGYWKMDEASWVNDCSSGVARDSSGNGNNGSACPLSTGPTGGSAGKFGNAPNLDGTNDYVFVSNFTKSSSKFTISAWVYANTRPTWGSILKNWGNNNRGMFHFGLESTGGDIGLHVYDGSSETTIRENTAIPLGSWQHVVAVADGSYLHLYRNGVEVATPVAYSGTLTTSFNCLGIGVKPNDTCNGADVGSPGYWDGKIDEARIYSRAFSKSEVKQLYDFAPGPIAEYDFEEGTGTTVYDKSGNNNTGTWGGTLGSQWTKGKFGKGGDFNGSDNSVNLGSSSNLNMTNQFSVSFWMNNAISGATYQYYVNRWTYTGGDFRQWSFDNTFGGGVANRINFRISSDGTDANTQYLGSEDVSYSSGWHHVTGTWDGATMRLYVDGVLKGTAVKTSMVSTPGKNTYIGGADLGAAYPLDGSVDEVKIYNYARTPAQVLSDMNGGHSFVGSPVGSAISHWKFDEGYGTTANNSGSSALATKGTLTNMASPATTVSGWNMGGKNKKALSFDGINDFVSIANNPSALQITSDLSISSWIYLTNTSSTHDIVSKKGSSGQFGYRLSTDTNGKLNFEISSAGSTTRAATGSSTLLPNAWYHVTGVFNPGNSITVYVNGKQDGQVTTSMPASIFNSSANVNIGAENNGASNFFAGIIDEPKIYSGILTADQIKRDYNQSSSLVLGSLSDTSGLTGGSKASNSASAEFCIPGDTSTCTAPVARWDFEEGTGSTVNDKSGNSNSGTWNGTLGSQWTKGKYGKGGNFNGSNNYVQMADSNSLSLGGGSLSFFAWIKSNDVSTTQTIIRKETIDYVLALVGSKIWCELNGASYGVNAGITLESGKWYHLGCTFDGTTFRAYVNGVEQGTDNTGTFPADSNGVLNIGSQAGGGQFFNGQIDQIQIFGYARTPAQIAWDYNRGAPVGHWKMDECQGTSIKDSSGNNFHGTWSGSGGGTQTAVGTCTTSSTAWGNGASGKFNSSLNFDGTDDYVEVLSNSIFDSSTGTWSGWFNTTMSYASKPFIMGRHNAAGSLSGINVTLSSTNGGLKIQIKDATGIVSDLTASSGLNDGNWHHWALTWSQASGGSVALYLDGKQMASGTTSNTWTFNSQVVRIGVSSDTFWAKYSGKIDDTRIYNYALTKQQIQQVMNQGSAVRFGPLSGTP